MMKLNLTIPIVVRISVIFIFVIFYLQYAWSATPSGANLTPGTPQTAPADAAGSALAQAGNVTQLNINGYSTTQTWQGYFGNVTGTIQLTDSNDRAFYNWTLASPEGEVYASTNQTVSWTNVQCFNFTAAGSRVGEAGQGGTTSLNGTNLSQLETSFNIAHDDVDGVNETFTFIGAGTHDAFFTANRQFDEGECRSTRIYSASGPVSNQFEEVLLYEPTTTSVVFASLLEEDVTGFNSGTHDFEMLVLEDGHGTDIAVTTYYFFVELA
jgi:hypothetical protein